MRKTPMIHAAKPGELLTGAEIAHYANVSERVIHRLTRRRMLPVVKLGYRTHRWHLPSVLAALARLEVKEIGRNE